VCLRYRSSGAAKEFDVIIRSSLEILLKASEAIKQDFLKIGNLLTIASAPYYSWLIKIPLYFQRPAARTALRISKEMALFQREVS